MTTEFYWRLPPQGDGRAADRQDWNRGDYTPATGHRHDYARTGTRRDGFTYYDLLVQVARAAELAGFDGLSIPQTAAGEEPLIVAGALAREIRRLKLLPSFPAQFIAPVYAAKIATSFQRLTAGRLAWHLHIDDGQNGAWHGRSRSREEQVARTGEFLDIVKGFWSDTPFDYKGAYYEVEKGGFAGPLAGQPLPEIHLSGDTEGELELAARHADIYLLTPAPLDQLKARIADIRARASGREVRFGLAADIIARHSDEAAWTHLRRQWEAAGSRTVTLTGEEADRPDFDSFRQTDGQWAGFAALRGEEGVGLVGGYETVAATLADYARAGIDRFLLGANPHLEEAYRVGEHVIPRVRALLAADRSAAA
ncbi:LLM class flavin-dependent oxidoreductase [Niveispirillum sp. KHB5.9]|uniref:LLM class flavin-dependent oxidoreductase n=1 Tax=Niveispirillum sp. KHB5.9 TaxID=3400269 RepID=UPI003A8C84A8